MKGLPHCYKSLVITTVDVSKDFPPWRSVVNALKFFYAPDTWTPLNLWAKKKKKKEKENTE